VRLHGSRAPELCQSNDSQKPKKELIVKIGFVSLPLSGHLNPMTALARKLQSRGNEVVFIGMPDAEAIVRAASLEFVVFCEKEYPLGSIPKAYEPIANLYGEDVIRYTAGNVSPGLLKAALEHLPGKLAETRVEALVIDAVHSFLQIVPMKLGMPFAQIWNVLHIDLSGTTPVCIFSWPHETTPEALARNWEGVKKAGGIFARSRAIAQSWAEENDLQIDWSDPTAITSKLALISQTPREFDFPNPNWPPQFHYAGPFHDDAGREQVPFPWEELTGKPLIYASLGTLVNGLEHVYRSILGAVGQLPEAQVVLSIGNNLDPDDLGEIPANTIVVRKAPQIELLKRASLCITHAGMNTALESLAQGVPMVAIPIGFDQPGVAARIAYHGAGEFVEVPDVTVEKLSELVQAVLNNPSYRDKARYFKDVIAQTHGLDVAAEVIERAFGVTRTSDPAMKSAELTRA
jgi:MGT family glycosyltransferase